MKNTIIKKIQISENDTFFQVFFNVIDCAKTDKKHILILKGFTYIFNLEYYVK